MDAADYPRAQWVPADPSNFRKAQRKPSEITLVVIHCTDGGPRAQNTAEMWQGAGHGSSAHFVIGQDGTVIQSVRLADVAYHAHAANALAAGIEHCARTPGELDKPGYRDPGLRPSSAQYAASAKLVAWLLRRAGLKPTREVVMGHAEADQRTTHTACPDGCGWAWNSYMALVQQEYDAWDAAS